MYELTYVKNLLQELLGYAIVKNIPDHAPKIEGSTLYTVDELEDAVERVNSLNEAQAIKENWPDQNDPEVQKLLADRNFEPNEASYTQQVMDPDHSRIVTYIDDDEYEQIDWNESDIVYTEVELESPSSSALRVHKASEVIARRRAGV